MHFYSFVLISFVEWGAWEASETLKIYDFHTCVMNSLVGWGTWAGPESLKLQTFTYSFHDFSGGAESMGGPRIIENINFFVFALLLWWSGERGKLQNH